MYQPVTQFETRQMELDTWDQATLADWVEVLTTFPVFSGIAKRRLRKLVRHATFSEYGRGDIVIQKGTPGNALHIILAGSAKALGKPASRSLRIGDYFGELSLLDRTTRSATVIATSELAPEPVPEPIVEPVPARVGEPAPAVVAATAERPAFTARPLPASVANPCEEAGIRVTIGCGGGNGTAP